MYDFDRQNKPSLCSFSPQTLCTYIPQSHTLRSIASKSHHYLKESHINQLIETICRELFYYSSSMQKAGSKEQQANVQNILLDNVKKIIVHNMDKHGLIMEQKIFYLTVSLLHSRHNQVTDLREFLQQVHCVLNSNLDPLEQIPFSLLMLLNGQFQQLLDYTKKQLSQTEDTTILENLIDILVCKIEESQSKQKNTQGSISQTHVEKIVTQVGKSNWLKLLITQIKKQEITYKAQIQKQNNKGQIKNYTLKVVPQKKMAPIFSIFDTKHQVEFLLAILCGDLQVIQEVCRGSWAMYLNLYINFVQPLASTKKQPYEIVVRDYMQKYFKSSKRSSKKLSQQQEQIFLIKVINTMSPQNRFSFHQIYQQSFSVFSPILSNLIGLLMIEYKLMDAYTISSNRDYHEDILLSLIDNCNKVGWSALVYMIGFVQNGSMSRDVQGKQAMWESLMFHYLPYEIQQSSKCTNIQNQIKQIQQKLQDLNLVGLSAFTRTYLTTLFNLLLSKSKFHLSPTILQIFFLTLQMSDSANVNYSFHQIKTFISRYYRTKHFDYGLITCLENIFERKQAILSEKIEQKVEKLFCLIYKIQSVYHIATGDGECENNIENELRNTKNESINIVIKQLIEFNKMFSSSNKKKPISLCIQLLRLSAYLHSRVENILNIGAEQIPQMPSQTQPQTHTHSELQLKAVRQFEWNLHNYLSQWKSFSNPNDQQTFSEQALEQLAYFDKYFY